MASYQNIMRQILTDAEDNDTSHIDGQLEVAGFNCAITPVRNRAEKQREAGKSKTKSKYALGKVGKQRVLERSTIEMNEVLCYFCLDLGCQHVRAEDYLHYGSLLCGSTPSNRDPCGDKSPICTKAWHEKMFLPVYKESIIQFFTSNVGGESLPYTHWISSIKEVYLRCTPITSHEVAVIYLLFHSVSTIPKQQHHHHQ